MAISFSWERRGKSQRETKIQQLGKTARGGWRKEGYVIMALKMIASVAKDFLSHHLNGSIQQLVISSGAIFRRVESKQELPYCGPLVVALGVLLRHFMKIHAIVLVTLDGGSGRSCKTGTSTTPSPERFARERSSWCSLM